MRLSGSRVRCSDYVEREATAKVVWSGFAPAVGKNSAMVLGLTRRHLYNTSSRTSTKTTSRRRRNQLLLFHASPRRTRVANGLASAGKISGPIPPGGPQRTCSSTTRVHRITSEYRCKRFRE
ncbi:unnamed protein product [Ectocarpus sp. 8 AP-2014]